ncbi:MAG: hypothetical protein ABI857_01830 [Acidobacteriota bacterium]
MRTVLLSRIVLGILVGIAVIGGPEPAAIASAQKERISVRTENFPRPPYSGATYYIYERNGEVICTKLRVCNKFDDCSTEYKKGAYKDEIDIETGEPYGQTDAVFIPANKLRKHVCLTKFKLTSK